MRRSLSAAVVAALLAAAPAAHAAESTSLALIGDVPYTPAQVTWMPTLIGDINADPDVDTAVHLGDIKSGSTVCSDAYFQQIRGFFDTFADPLVYTPGDNEWTDCHRANNGGYVPTERLAKLREVFYPQPGWTLGADPRPVTAQAAPYVENVRWIDTRVVFATLHVVGSNNDLAGWFGLPPTPLQLDEAHGRIQAAVAWIDAAFDQAEAEHAKGVVLLMQADMWEGTPQDGFDAIKDRITGRAAAFKRPVLLVQGDSHSYKEDNPLPGAPNVTRIVVEGAAAGHEWLKLTVRANEGKTFSWAREQLAPPAS